MSRYFTRRKVRSFDIDEDVPLIPQPQRSRARRDVPEHEETFTGLLDASGEEIWRQPRPVGFGRDKEWS